MSQISIFNIKIIGEGGHGSAPEGLKVAIWKAVQFYQKIMNYVNELKAQNRNFAFTLPVFKSGERFNVIGQSASIQGSLRSFDQQTRDLVLNKVKGLLDKVEEEGFKVQYGLVVSCKNDNSKKEADNVLRVAAQAFGKHMSSKGTLPFRASEDFGCYTQLKPGAFFFLCHKNRQDEPPLHNPKYNFKDDLIEIGATFWLKLAIDRLLS